MSLSFSTYKLKYFFFFVFSLILRPPISTLFPYTTLFRSYDELLDSLQARSAARAAAPHRHPDGERDRKSTRLNSSHGSISYAVFCLKKKSALQHRSRVQDCTL